MLKGIRHKLTILFLCNQLYSCAPIITVMEFESSKNLIENLTNFRLNMKQYIQRKLKEGNFDVTFEMLQVLGLLWRKQDLNQQEIANAVQKNKASITPIIDNLTRRKLVVRSEDPSDKRSRIISLTPAGREYKEQFMPVINEFYKLMETGLTNTEIEQAARVIQKMNGNLNS